MTSDWLHAWACNGARRNETRTGVSFTYPTDTVTFGRRCQWGVTADLNTLDCFSAASAPTCWLLVYGGLLRTNNAFPNWARSDQRVNKTFGMPCASHVHISRSKGADSFDVSCSFVFGPARLRGSQGFTRALGNGGNLNVPGTLFVCSSKLGLA